MRALVIDDSMTYLVKIKAELESLGYTVHTVQKIRDAMQLPAVNYDIVICDVYMESEQFTPHEIVTLARAFRTSVVLTISGATDVGADIIKGATDIGEIIHKAVPTELSGVLKRLNNLIERHAEHDATQENP